MKGLHHQVAKKLGLEKLSLWQRDLISYFYILILGEGNNTIKTEHNFSSFYSNYISRRIILMN